MVASFNCPNCGAPLDYQGHDPIIRCPYCNSSVIVPENLRARPSFSSTPGNFTLSGIGDMGGLIKQARRINEVKNLAEAGEYDQAVALYREITGADEFSARQSVNALAAGRPVMLTGAGSGLDASTPGVLPPPPSPPRARGRIGGLGCALTFLAVCGVAMMVLGSFAFFGAGSFIAAEQVISEAGVDSDSLGLEIPEVAGFARQEMSFGGEGSGPGLFGDARSIAVDPVSGNIYVAEYEGGRVQAFDAQGEFLTQWAVSGESDPYIVDLAADRSGRVYVVVFGRILLYDATGKPLGAIEAPESGNIDSLDIAADGSLVAISHGEDIVWYSPDFEVVRVLESAVSSVSGDSELSSHIAVDGLGNLYVLGRFNNSVFVYGPDGKYKNRFGSEGDQPGQFRAPYVLEVDGQGRIFVSDFNGVQVFDSDGRYIDVINTGYFVYGLAFDDQGQLYVTTNQKMVEKYVLND